MKIYCNFFVLTFIAFSFLISDAGKLAAQSFRATGGSPLVRAGRDEARKFDEYGNISEEDTKARLDNFAISIKSENAVQGYIITYGGRRGVKGTAKKTADAAKAYLVKSLKIPSARLIAIDGGYREEMTTELWLVPKGAASPYAQPSVDPSEVTFITAAARSKKTKAKSTAKVKAKAKKKSIRKR